MFLQGLSICSSSTALVTISKLLPFMPRAVFKMFICTGLGFIVNVLIVRELRGAVGMFDGRILELNTLRFGTKQAAKNDDESGDLYQSVWFCTSCWVGRALTPIKIQDTLP